MNMLFIFFVICFIFIGIVLYSRSVRFFEFKLFKKYNNSKLNNNKNIEYFENTFNSNRFFINCKYEKIQSIPGDIIVNKEHKGKFYDEIKNNELEKMLKQNLKIDKKRFAQLKKGLIYKHENTDSYFKNKIGLILALKFESWLSNVFSISKFECIKVNINKLFQPNEYQTSRNYYIDVDFLIHRKDKNHGKHLNIVCEVTNIKSLEMMLFKFDVYDLKVLGVVFEDKIKMLENDISEYNNKNFNSSY